MKYFTLMLLFTLLWGCASVPNKVNETEKESVQHQQERARAVLSEYFLQKSVINDKYIKTPFLWQYGRIILPSEMNTLKDNISYVHTYEKGWVSVDYLYVYKAKSKKIIPVSDRSLFKDLIIRIEQKIITFNDDSRKLGFDNTTDMFVVEVIDNKTKKSQIYLQETDTGIVRGLLM